MTVPEGGTLAIGDAVQFINKGTIKKYGTINGTITNSGDGKIISASSVTVTFADKDGKALQNNTAAYGDTIIVTATISEGNGKAKLLSQEAEANTVNFYYWNAGYSDKLNDTAIPVVNGKATLGIELLDSNKFSWTPSEIPYGIIAEFSGNGFTF